MVAFTPIVQADFSGTAFGSAPTWTDITRFARLKASPINITKWRLDQLSDVAPSTMTLTLDNAAVDGDATAPNAGRFTPGLSTSPWYPHILPGVRIRAGVTIGGTTYWRFDGYVTSWDASYDNGDFEICTVMATDWLGRAGGMDLLRGIYVEEVLSDKPTALFPLNEPAGATSPGDLSTADGGPLMFPSMTAGAGNHTFANATGIPTDGTSTLTLNGTLGTSVSDDFRGDFMMRGDPLYSNAGNIAGPSTIEAWVSLNSSLASALSRNPSSLIWVAGTSWSPGGAQSMSLQLGYDSGTGAIRLRNQIGGALVGPDLNDGGVHHLVVAFSTGTGGATNYYVDGVNVATAAGTLSNAGAVYIGGWPPMGGLNPAFRGGIGYVAFYSTALSATRVAAHNQAARTGFPGEGTATHVARLLTYRTNLGSTLDTGQGTVSIHQFTGQSLQQALLDTAKAEGGLTYVDPTSGSLVFRDRTRLRNPAVAVTLDVTAQQVAADLTFRADTQDLLNDVTISHPGGATQRRTDATSKSTYGTKGLNEQRIIGSDADALNAAGWLIATNKDTRLRLPTVSVDLLTEPSTTLATSVLNLLPLQRISLANTPASAPVTDSIVQGCTDVIGVDVFTCTFNVSALPRPTLRFDASADSFTKLDSGNVFAW